MFAIYERITIFVLRLNIWCFHMNKGLRYLRYWLCSTVVQVDKLD